MTPEHHFKRALIVALVVASATFAIVYLLNEWFLNPSLSVWASGHRWRMPLVR